mmetsp:Transcript_28748/g.63320  ORF Transcript_28748/g.63320 Transcript_28748/m.63320 type:complete len:81 (-) Transcript_28748:1544-1786(-)
MAMSYMEAGDVHSACCPNPKTLQHRAPAPAPLPANSCVTQQPSSKQVDMTFHPVPGASPDSFHPVPGSSPDSFQAGVKAA